MPSPLYLDLARTGARFPIGAHLVLAEKPNHERLLLDGAGLGAVVVEAARRYHTPLALPLMDLMVEKADLLARLGVPAATADVHHFDRCPEDHALDLVRGDDLTGPTPRMVANAQAIRHVAATTDLLPVGMVIGPFSLMTKLLADPITPVFLAGGGTTAAEDPEVRTLERALELAARTVERAIRFQAAAGARAVCVCEPAANSVFVSPRQLHGPGDIFDRAVMANLRRVRRLTADLGVDLILHDCGEVTDDMVRRFGTLEPAILSLGSPRNLWDVAPLLPPDVVLYGNLPTKRFYSDAEVPLAKVEQLVRDLHAHMRALGRPFILGSECDVLSVPGSEATIQAKVERMLTCAA